MSPRLEGLAWACFCVLAFAAFYETLVAIEVIAPGGDVVLVAALLAYLVSATVSVVHAVEARCERRPVWIALAPVGGVYLMARWYSFDPYYLPTLRRYADGGVSGWWIALVAGAAMVAALITVRLPRGGAVWSSVVLLVTAFTVFLLPLGK